MSRKVPERFPLQCSREVSAFTDEHEGQQFEIFVHGSPSMNLKKVCSPFPFNLARR